MIKTVSVLLSLFVSSYAATLGTVCDSSNTCTTTNTYCYQQSACTKGVCVCNGGYVASGGICVQERLIGDSCTTGVCIAGSCTGGTCQCQSGWTTAGDRRRCIGKTLGQSCTTVADCQGTYEAYPTGIRCGTDSTCQCQVGYKAYDSYSCIWYGDGESCQAGTTVCAPGTAECSSNVCSCLTLTNTKYVWQMFTRNGYTFGYCVHPSATENVGYGETCTKSDFSANGRFCASNLVCSQCPENYGTSIYECLNGVEAMKASFLLLSIVAILSIIKIMN